MPLPDRLQDPPSRAVVEALRARMHRGGWSKADLFVIPSPGGGPPIVIKDFSRKSVIVRWLGRFQIGRECAAYASLDGVEGTPIWHGRVDAHALALERLEGTLLQRHRKGERRRELLAELRSILDAIHACGIVHNDLRGKDNAFVRTDGRLVLLDFAGAFLFRPGSMWHRLLFRRLVRVDEAAYLKWKRILDPESMTAEEERSEVRPLRRSPSTQARTEAVVTLESRAPIRQRRVDRPTAGTDPRAHGFDVLSRTLLGSRVQRARQHPALWRRSAG
jgi:hypothetical protein